MRFKNFSKSVLIFFVTILLMGSLFAQTEVRMSREYSGDDMMLKMDIAAADFDTLTSYDSQLFSLSGYHGTWDAYYAKQYVSASLKPRITTTLQGTFDGTNFVAVDTLGIVSDSVETYQTGTITNNPGKLYPYYRILNTAETGNPSDVVLDVDIFFIKD